MFSLFNIWSVGLYESKALVRGALFKVFVFVIVLIGILFLFVFTRNAILLPSAYPVTLLLFFTSFLALFTIFSAVEIFTGEQKVDFAQVIYTRAISNLELMLGKAFGVFMAMGSGTMILLFSVACIRFAFFGTKFSFAGYFLSPLLMAVPMLITLIGTSFLCTALIRSKALAITSITVLFVWVTFIIGSEYHNLFDYASLRVPMLFGDFAGFGNIFPILQQRVIWFLIGLTTLFLSSLFIKRIPNSLKEKYTVLCLAVLFLGSAAVIFETYLSDIQAGKELRSRMNALSHEEAKKQRVTVTDCHLDLFHRRKKIDVTATLYFWNNNTAPVKQYTFNLNPGLKVYQIFRGKANVPFSQNLHLITVDPRTPLPHGGMDSLTIKYQGQIEEKACYADIDERYREIQERRDSNYIKRYGFINSNYVLLTPECLWYPTAGAPYGSVFPKTTIRDFTRFTLKVETDPKLTALSQGAARKSDKGLWIFTPGAPLPQISLTIGDYEKKAVMVDGIEYAVFVKRGHDYFSRPLNETREKLPEIIRGCKKYYEGYVGYSYPYPRFALVESPIQFYAFRRFWSAGMETVQPEQVFIQEMGMGLSSSHFDVLPYNHAKMTQIEIKTGLVNQFAYNTLLNRGFDRLVIRMSEQRKEQHGWSMEKFFRSKTGHDRDTNIFPNFYRFTNAVRSDKQPLLNSAIEFYQESKVPSSLPPSRKAGD